MVILKSEDLVNAEEIQLVIKYKYQANNEEEDANLRLSDVTAPESFKKVSIDGDLGLSALRKNAEALSRRFRHICDRPKSDVEATKRLHNILDSFVGVRKRKSAYDSTCIASKRARISSATDSSASLDEEKRHSYEEKRLSAFALEEEKRRAASTPSDDEKRRAASTPSDVEKRLSLSSPITERLSEVLSTIGAKKSETELERLREAPRMSSADMSMTLNETPIKERLDNRTYNLESTRVEENQSSMNVEDLSPDKSVNVEDSRSDKSANSRSFRAIKRETFVIKNPDISNRRISQMAEIDDEESTPNKSANVEDATLDKSAKSLWRFKADTFIIENPDISNRRFSQMVEINDDESTPDKNSSPDNSNTSNRATPMTVEDPDNANNETNGLDNTNTSNVSMDNGNDVDLDNESVDLDGLADAFEAEGRRVIDRNFPGIFLIQTLQVRGVRVTREIFRQ